MIEVAELEWYYERKLMCLVNRIGMIDVYQVSIHGGLAKTYRPRE
jgi:hypothetical protein